MNIWSGFFSVGVIQGGDLSFFLFLMFHKRSKNLRNAKSCMSKSIQSLAGLRGLKWRDHFYTMLII